MTRWMPMFLLAACEPSEGPKGTGTGDTAAPADSAEDTGCEPGEPNDTFADATAVEADGSVLGACVSSGDGAADPFDTYALVAPGPGDGIVTVTMSGGPTPEGEAGNEFIVTSAVDEQPLLDVYVFGDASVTGWFAARAGATYYVQTLRFGGGGPTLTYDLSFAPTPFDDPSEPNQSDAAATPLTLGAPIRASAAAATERSEPAPGDADDWYVVNVGAGDLTVALTEAPADFPCDVEVLDAGLVRVAGTFADPGGDCVVTATDLPGGQVYVVVRGFAGEPPVAGEGAPPPRVTGHYTIRVDQ